MLFFCCAVNLGAQALREAKLTASDGSANDTFGFAVALDHDLALIGTSGDASGRGAAYVFERNAAAPFTWLEKQKLVARDGTPDDAFGFAVALTPEYALIGARNDNELGSGAGAAYVFKQQNSTWVQTAKLTARAGGSFDYFGNAVALSGDYALIGAPGENFEHGAAYIFERKVAGAGETWQEAARLQGRDGASGDHFGVAVAWAEEYALVSAHGNDERSTDAGAVFVFQREQTGSGQTWMEKFKIMAPDGEASDFFGVSLAASGHDLIIGAHGVDDQADHAGAAYVFVRREVGGAVQWQQQAKLTAGDGAANDDFGNAVAISGEYALAGALMQFSQGRGGAYLYKRENERWRELIKIAAHDGELNDRFGNAVALAEDRALVGARFEDAKGDNAGAAYLYEGISNLVGVESRSTALPHSFALAQNHPNPFNPATTITFSLLRPAMVTLTIYDARGAEIAVLIAAAAMAACKHEVHWQPQGLAGGIYLCRLQAGEQVQSKKLVMLR